MAEQTSSFKKWYAENKSSFNAARRQRYRKDKNYRKRLIAQAARYRALHPVPPRKRERRQTLSVGEAANALAISIQTLRKFEAKGYIPPVKKGPRHRRYTARQIELVRELVNYLRENHYQTLNYRRSIEKIAAKIHKQWKE